MVERGNRKASRHLLLAPPSTMDRCDAAPGRPAKQRPRVRRRAARRRSICPHRSQRPGRAPRSRRRKSLIQSRQRSGPPATAAQHSPARRTRSPASCCGPRRRLHHTPAAPCDFEASFFSRGLTSDPTIDIEITARRFDMAPRYGRRTALPMDRFATPAEILRQWEVLPLASATVSVA